MTNPWEEDWGYSEEESAPWEQDWSADEEDELLSSLDVSDVREKPEKGRLNILGGIKDIGKLLYDIPVQTKGSIAGLLEEEDPFATRDWRDKWREAATERTKQRLSELSDEQKKERLATLPIIGDITREDIAETSGSTGFSLTSMGASLAGGLVGAPLGGYGAIPAGMAAGGTAAYRMDKNMVTVQLLEQVNNALVEERGTPMTDEERKELLASTDKLRSTHALWEAGPEAVGNALALTGLGKIFTGVSKRFIPKVVGGLTMTLGGELSTETVTEKGQGKAEVGLGMREQEPTWGEAFSDIAAPTALLTGLMGGGAAVGGQMARASDQFVGKLKEKAGEKAANLRAQVEESESSPISTVDQVIAEEETKKEADTLEQLAELPVQEQTFTMHDVQRENAKVRGIGDWLEARLGDTGKEELFNDFVEQGEEEIRQGSVRERRAAFKKLQEELRAKNLAEFEQNMVGRVTPETSELAKQTEPTEEQKRAERIGGIREAFEDAMPEQYKTAVNEMERQLTEGETGSRFQKDDGTWDGVKTTNPEFIQLKTLKEYDRKNGTSLAGTLNKKSFGKVVDKVRKGQRLSSKQQEIWEYIQQASKSVATIDEDYNKAIAEVGELSAPQRIPVGEIEPGEKVVVDRFGSPDVVEHKGFDEKGNAILEDGSTIVADVFDQIEILGRKKGTKAEHLAEKIGKKDYSFGEGNNTEEKKINQLATDVVEKPIELSNSLLDRVEKNIAKGNIARAKELLAEVNKVVENAADKGETMIAADGPVTEQAVDRSMQESEYGKVRKRIAELSGRIEPQEATDDSQKEGRIPRSVGEGEEPGRAIPEQEGGTGQAEAGGISQAAEEKIAEEQQRAAGKKESPKGKESKEIAKPVLLKKPTVAEKRGGTPRSRGFNKLPEAPEGFKNVYKPYGEEGPGYYRIDNRDTLRAETEQEKETPQKPPVPEAPEKGVPAKPAHEMTLDEFVNDALARNKYRESYEKDEELLAKFKQDRERDWRRELEKAAKTNIIPDNVLDDYAERYGVDAVKRVFRGVAEKGAKKWIPKDIREQERTLLVEKPKPVSLKPVYERTWEQHRREVAKGIPRKLKRYEWQEERKNYESAVRKAYWDKKKILDEVLAQFPDLKPSAESISGSTEAVSGEVAPVSQADLPSAGPEPSSEAASASIPELEKQLATATTVKEKRELRKRIKAAKEGAQEAKGEPEKPAQEAQPEKQGEKTEAAKEDEKPQGERELVSINKDDIPYSLAMDAHRGSSFVPEERARQEQDGYVSHMQGLVDELSKLAKTDEQKKQLREWFQWYKPKYIEKYKAKLAADSRTMSSMITGPSKFPTRMNQKRLDTAQKRLEELLEWDRKAIARIKGKLRGTEAISSTDTDAVTKLEKKLANLEEAQELMKSANKIIKNKKLTDEQKVEQLSEVGIKKAMADELLKPDFAGRVGFAGYQLSNNNAEIRRVKERIGSLGKRKEVAESLEGGSREVEFVDGTVELNYEDGYLRLHYNGKPDAETRASLKKNGFRWTPSETAWRRKLNNQAIWAAESVTGAKIKEEPPKLSQTTPTSASTVSQVRTALTTGLRGKKVRRLIEEGKLRIVQSVKELPEGGKFMVAWHGSPYKFDKFSTEKIGTGEGAQAYGYGLYFASRKEVADWYKEKLAVPVFSSLTDKVKAITIDGESLLEKYDVETEEWMWQDAKKGDVELFLQDSRDSSARWRELENDETYPYRDYAKKKAEGHEALQKALEDGATLGYPTGTTYQVELAPAPEDYLLWDKPLSEQSKKVKKILADNWVAHESLNQTGREIYEAVAVERTNDQSTVTFDGLDYKRASEYLHSLGIRGIKYLDGTSRAKGEGAYNYVIFSDEDVEITGKYSQQKGINGAYYTTQDRIYLVADNITPGTETETLLHEGFHREVERMKAGENPALQKIMDSLADLEKRKSTEEWFTKARKAAQVAKDSPHYIEEIGAYAVTQYTAGEKQPFSIRRWVKKLLAYVKVALLERYGIMGKLDDAMLARIAERGLRVAPVKEEGLAAEGEPAFSQIAKEMGISIEEAKRQYEAVEKQYRGTDQWMKAPNGQPTELNERQWVQVRTPAFREWFGDFINDPENASKVVDENGEPMVVYHGTDSIFDTFTKSGDIGYHFGTELAARDRAAKVGGAGVLVEPITVDQREKDSLDALEGKIGGTPADDLYALLLRKLDSPRVDLRKQVEDMDAAEIEAVKDEYLEMPDSPRFIDRIERARKGEGFKVEANGIEASFHKTAREANAVAAKLRRRSAKPMALFLRIKNPIRMADLGVWPAQEIAGVAGFSKSEMNQVANADNVSAQYEEVRRILGRKGFDGIVYRNEVENTGEDSYIAFSPNQIKSAIGNTGQFGPTGDIRFSNGTPIQRVTEKMLNSEAFKTWFGKSRFFLPSGKPMMVYHGTDGNFLTPKGEWIFDSSKGKSRHHSPLAGLGNFFALDRNEAMGYTGGTANVRAFYVAVENPLVLNSWDLNNLQTREEAEAFAKRMELRGHDGVYFPDQGHVVVFDGGNIKSAEFQTGEWDRGMKDVRYSLAGNENSSLTEDRFSRFAERIDPRWQDRWERFIYTWVDRDDPKRLIQNRYGEQPEATNYLAAERLRGKKEAAEVEKFHREELSPLLKFLASSKLEISDLEEYAYAKHVPEANERLKKVNARRELLTLLSRITGKENEELRFKLEELDAELEIDSRHEGYLDLLDEEFAKIPEKRRQLEAEKKALDNREWTAEEEEKGTPARLYRQNEKRFERLAGIERQQEAWDNRKDRLSGITDEEAGEIVSRWEQDKRFAKVEAARQKLAAINQKKLDILFEAGELTEEQYDSITNMYEFYVPLYREGYEDEGLPARGRMTGPIGKPLQVRAGSLRGVVDILAHSVANRQSAIIRKHRLEAGKKLYNLVQENPGAEWWIEESKKEPTFDSGGNIVYYPSMKEPANGVHVKIDGKRYTIMVDSQDRTMMRMIKSIKEANVGIGPIVEMLGKISRILAALNTSFSPEFMITNFGRDIQTAGINLEDSVAKGAQAAIGKNVFSAIRGIYRTERGKRSEWTAVYRDFEDNGGKIGWMQSYETIEDLAGQLESEMKIYGEGHTLRKNLVALKELVQSGNTAIENGVRLSTYKYLVDNGVSKQKAALTASNLTVDFTRRGAAGQNLNALYMFANAGIQGNVRMIKAAVRSAKVRKLLGGIVGTGFALHFLALLTGGDDDDGIPFIDKVDDSEKERSMLIMLKDGKKIKIPMPYGYNVFFNLGDELAEMTHHLLTGREYSPLQGMARIGSVFMNSFNPLSSATLLQTIMPTVGDPIAMVAENKTWYGGDLMPEKNPFGIPKPDSERYWKSASFASREIASRLNALTGGDRVKPGLIDVSPETLDLMVDTYTGSAGRFIKNTLMLPFKALEGDLSSRNVPFIRTVFGTQFEGTDANLYRRNADRVLTLKAQVKAAQGERRRQLMQSKEYRLVKITDSYEKRLKELYSRLRLLESKGITDERADRIKEAIKKRQKKYNQHFNTVISR